MNQSKGKARPQTSKRAANSTYRGESRVITGGSGDIKPEFLSYVATQSASDTTTTTTTALPVLRNFQTSGNRAQIVEVLKVIFSFNQAQVETDSNVRVFVSTKNFGTTATTFQDPAVIAMAGWYMAITTSGQVTYPQLQTLDLTDGNGNGILVATDNLFTQVTSSGTSLSNAIGVKVLYRIYSAGVTEYIGIVQGQQ